MIPLADEEEVHAFMKAVYPGFSDLALSVFSEKIALREALEKAPIRLLHGQTGYEIAEMFVERYKDWYRGVRNKALSPTEPPHAT